MYTLATGRTRGTFTTGRTRTLVVGWIAEVHAAQGRDACAAWVQSDGVYDPRTTHALAPAEVRPANAAVHALVRRVRCSRRWKSEGPG